MTVMLALTIPHSMYSVACGLVIMTFVEFFVNFAATRHYTMLSWERMVGAIAPSFVLSLAMGVVVMNFHTYITSVCEIPYIVLLLSEIVLGVLFYTFGAWIFRFEALKEFIQVVKGVLKR